MFTDHKKFNYEQPRMTYDKTTGDVTIHDPKDDIKQNRIINNIDEVLEEKQKLFEELELDSEGMPTKPIDVEELSEKYKIVKKQFEEEYEVDPSQFYAFARDKMRIDVGMMI
jgi:hypothetical protein